MRIPDGSNNKKTRCSNATKSPTRSASNKAVPNVLKERKKTGRKTSVANPCNHEKSQTKFCVEVVRKKKNAESQSQMMKKATTNKSDKINKIEKSNTFLTEEDMEIMNQEKLYNNKNLIVGSVRNRLSRVDEESINLNMVITKLNAILGRLDSLLQYEFKEYSLVQQTLYGSWCVPAATYGTHTEQPSDNKD